MACTNLDFLNEDSISICMYHSGRWITKQYSSFCTFDYLININDWLGLEYNFPLKNIQLYNESEYYKMKKILKGLQCLKI